MNQEKSIKLIIAKLDAIEKRLNALEKNRRNSIATPTRINQIKRGDGLPKLILELRNKNFFRPMKSSKDVHNKISPTYPCDPNRVTMALIRLRKRKQLRRATKKEGEKKVDAFAW